MASISVFVSPTPSIARATLSSRPQLKRSTGFLLNCSSEPPPQLDSEDRARPALLGISTYSWRAGLGALGFVEAGYLTFSKLTGSESFCPLGAGSCGEVLNSDYSYVFGVPLPLIGMLAYGLVALLALQQSGKNLFSGLNETDVRLILLGTTTAMATASAYFLYLLSTKFAGTSCSYCLLSAILSFSLFFVTLKDFGMDEIRKVVSLQLVIAGVIVTALSNSYSPQLNGSNDITLEPYATEITEQSTPFAVSLAKHLKAIGAKMYGAFWCSHCLEQKQMFGREATKLLDYVECFPDGAGKGRKMAEECTAAGLEGFPTWIIKDKVLSGDQELSTLAEASGFVIEDSHPS